MIMTTLNLKLKNVLELCTHLSVMHESKFTDEHQLCHRLRLVSFSVSLICYNAQRPGPKMVRKSRRKKGKKPRNN